MKKLDENSIGGRLRQIRKKYKMTQTEFGKEIKASFRSVCDWERGERQLPIDILIAICKEYDVSADWLLGLSNET